MQERAGLREAIQQIHTDGQDCCKPPGDLTTPSREMWRPLGPRAFCSLARPPHERPEPGLGSRAGREAGAPGLRALFGGLHGRPPPLHRTRGVLQSSSSTAAAPHSVARSLPPPPPAACCHSPPAARHLRPGPSAGSGPRRARQPQARQGKHARAACVAGCVLSVQPTCQAETRSFRTHHVHADTPRPACRPCTASALTCCCWSTAARRRAGCSSG